MQTLNESDRARAVTLLRRALPEGAQVALLRDAHDPSALRIAIGETPFLIRLTLRAADEFDERQASPLPVLVLRTREPKEREPLRQKGQSFVDLAGAVHIRTSGFYLDRTDLPSAPAPEARRGRVNPYTDRASRLIRALLTVPTSRRWSTQDLAAAGDVDVSTASRVVRELRRRHLVRDECPGQGRRSRIWVPEPEALLDDWARSYRWLDNAQARVAAPIGSARRFIARMPELLAGERWALALHAGASLFAPHAEFDVIHAYLDTDDSLEALAVEKEWELTPSGKLCLLAPFYRQSVWFQSRTVKGVPVVSPVQLVLDLWYYPVRGREQAEHLIETVLRPMWESDDEST